MSLQWCGRFRRGSQRGDSGQLLVVEDAGDKLHAQRDALDSGYLLDVATHIKKGRTALRWLAEGCDASAAYDQTFSPGYNDGDNEITGFPVSISDVPVAGILGARVPQLVSSQWRMFWTQQDGDNVTSELPAAAGSRNGVIQ